MGGAGCYSYGENDFWNRKILSLDLKDQDEEIEENEDSDFLFDHSIVMVYYKRFW